MPVFRIVQAFVPLPKDNFSELIVTGSRENNGTLVIVCVVDFRIQSVRVIIKSRPVRLLVYGKSDACLILQPYRLLDYNCKSNVILASLIVHRGNDYQRRYRTCAVFATKTVKRRRTVLTCTASSMPRIETIIYEPRRRHRQSIRLSP